MGEDWSLDCTPRARLNVTSNEPVRNHNHPITSRWPRFYEPKRYSYSNPSRPLEDPRCPRILIHHLILVVCQRSDRPRMVTNPWWPRTTAPPPCTAEHADEEVPWLPRCPISHETTHRISRGVWQTQVGNPYRESSRGVNDLR